MTDLRHLDLNLLKAFDALMDERNVTRAAERLAVTQPAVSGMLTRLRDNFDDTLFVRAQRGVVPTQRAQELAAPIKQILAEVNALLQPQEFDPTTARFTVQIAATDYALRAVVLPLLPVLRRQAPNIRVAVRALHQEHLAAQFERGEVDLALLTPESVSADLHSRHLFDERYICVLRSGHPEACCEQISMERFCALDHALVSLDGDPFHGVTDRTLTELGHRRHVAVSLLSFLALLELLRNSDLISLLPEKLLKDVEGLTQVEPPLTVPGFTKVAAWHERSHRDPGQAWVRQILFERFCDSD